MLKTIYRLLSPAQRRQSLRMVLAVLVRAVLDFAGVAALIPVLLAVLKPGEGDRAQTLLLCGAVLLFVAVKNGAVVWLARMQSRFQQEIYRDLSRRMFVRYYENGLLFLRSKSSVQLGYEVNQVCYLFSQGVLTPLFRMAGEAILVLMMVTALLLWEPMAGALLCAVFLPLSVVYAHVVRRRLRQYGQEEIAARRRLSRTVVEAFRGYVEVEIAQAFHTSLAAFDRGQDTVCRSRLRMETYQLAPAFLSEAAMVGGLALLIGVGQGDLGVVSGVFAVAAFRLIPAMRSLLNSWGALQNSSHTLEVVAEATQEPAGGEAGGEAAEAGKADREAFTLHDKITLQDLAFAFPDGHTLFRGLDLEIPRGSRVGIRGTSGAGKSTLFNLMLGFLEPTEGEIRIDGKRLTPRNRSAWHRLTGYVPQEIFIMEGTLADNVALGDPEPDRDRVARVLETVQLGDWTAQLPQGLDTPLGEYGSRLSGGQKQRIGIARALYKEAQVLFLDEATSALDNRTEQEINLALEELSARHRELTLIVIAHRESSLAFCDRVFELEPLPAES